MHRSNKDVATLDVLFAAVGSAESLPIPTWFVIVVAPPRFVFIFTVSVNTATSFAAIAAFEKTTFPVPPTGGVAMLQPDPVVTPADTKVVFAGTGSVTTTLAASLGPLFFALIE